ncbi:MAG: FAD-dependent oxidoreductase [Streptosporangiales bacterium]|nr:FAD-dependent oxidoreductase [Streptosporangiales bacterium]
MTTYVIVGGGLAGAKAAQTLRDEGFDGEVVLFCDEADAPYERPPLSKDYLNGKASRSSVFVHPEKWYAEHHVDLRTGTPVTAIDRAAHTVSYSGGSVPYDKLLLATGASPRRLGIPGDGLKGVHYLRRLGDAEALRESFRHGAHVIVVGAGWIGLEAAAAARKAGHLVTVLEPQPTPLHGVLGPELGERFQRLHAGHGVEFRFSESAAEFHGDAGHHVGSVLTRSGKTLTADTVVVGIGAVPNDGLAADAGLDTDGGVVTDAALRTSDPDIFAAGDVANSHNPLFGRRIRVDHWANALNGGQAAARSMLGQEVSYDRVPYFFSDQYGFGLECSGLPSPGSYDRVFYRGDADKSEFIAFWLNAGKVIAAMNVNVWDVTGDLQSLIRSAREVDPVRLTDPRVPLSDV